MIRNHKHDPVKMVTLKIIPHRNVRNNETRRLYSALHDLFLPSGTNRISTLAKRFCGASAEPASMWWVVRIEADADGKKRIEYFTVMPEGYVDAYKTKFRGHEGWKSCTIEPTDQFVATTDMIKETDLYRLGYKRHDMFSLGFDYSEQETPIRGVMAVVEEMKAGESVTLWMRMESVDRMKWKKSAEYAWEQWQKGAMVYRAGFDPVRLARSVYALGESGFHKLHDGGSAVAGALGRQFFNPKDVEFGKKERPKRTNHDREELLVNGDLSTRTKNKRNLPVFKTSIRFTVTSADPVRREMLARSLASAYEHTAKDERWKDNVLMAQRIKLNAKKEMQSLARWRIHDLDPLMMSVDEVGKLCQLPTAALQEEFKDYLESNQRTEIEIPKMFLDDTGILVGTATDRGVIHNIHIPTVNKDFLFTPRVVCGSPRMGKDQHVINMVVEAKLKHGIGAVIPDMIDERNGHRGMADAIRDHLPPEEIIDLDLGDTQNPVYLGLQGIVENIPDVRIAADRIAEEITAFILSDGDEDKMQTADFTREAAKVTMGDPLGIKLMFMSDKYRQEMVDGYSDLFDMDIWQDYEKMSDGKRGQIYGPIMRRLGQIMNSEFLKPIFCQSPNPAVQLHKWIEEGKVVIFRIPGKMMSERVKEILVYWIVLNVFLIKLALDGKGAGTFLVINEPHQALSDGLIHFMERMLSEGPKYRLAPVIIFHDFSQFRKYPGFENMLMAATVNWHLFKNTNERVYERMMPYLSRTFDTPQQAFDATKKYQYIGVWLNPNGEYERPFVADSLPMVGDRHETRDNSHVTKQHSKKYGRPIKHVLEEIKKKNRLVFQE